MQLSIVVAEAVFMTRRRGSKGRRALFVLTGIMSFASTGITAPDVVFRTVAIFSVPKNRSTAAFPAAEEPVSPILLTVLGKGENWKKFPLIRSVPTAVAADASCTVTFAIYSPFTHVS